MSAQEQDRSPAQHRVKRPGELERDLLEALRFQVRTAIEALSSVDRGLAELTVLEGHGAGLLPETQEWAAGGIEYLVGYPLRRVQLEVAR